MQPPSADKLYRQIDAATADGDMNGLKEIQPKIEQFLTNYPDDPRAEQVAALGEESEARKSRSSGPTSRPSVWP